MAVSGAGGRLTHTADAARQPPRVHNRGLQGGQNPRAAPQKPPVPSCAPKGPAGTGGMGSALQC